MVFCGKVGTVESNRTGGVLKVRCLRGLPAGQVILTERSQEGLSEKQGPQGGRGRGVRCYLEGPHPSLGTA